MKAKQLISSFVIFLFVTPSQSILNKIDEKLAEVEMDM